MRWWEIVIHFWFTFKNVDSFLNQYKSHACDFPYKPFGCRYPYKLHVTKCPYKPVFWGYPMYIGEIREFLGNFLRVFWGKCSLKGDGKGWKDGDGDGNWDEEIKIM